jgi:hypothetical protein
MILSITKEVSQHFAGDFFGYLDQYVVLYPAGKGASDHEYWVQPVATGAQAFYSRYINVRLLSC